MRAAQGWKDYELLDASQGERLERWGRQIVVRPDPQVIWNTPRDEQLWGKAQARYCRSSRGGGHWEFAHGELKRQTLHFGELAFQTQPTGFKHMGLFPEQAVNWQLFSRLISQQRRPVAVLNLFAYTGGATLACAQAGASVCHVDASKGMVDWARKNAAVSGLADKPIRWIVDDCEKFALRECRRGRTYDAVILDPPSYGRGPNGEVWKLEDKLYDLLKILKNLLSEHPLFFALNSYTTGLSAATMEHLLRLVLGDRFEKVRADEIGLCVKRTGLVLPCGSTAYALGSQAQEFA